MLNNFIWLNALPRKTRKKKGKSCFDFPPFFLFLVGGRERERAVLCHRNEEGETVKTGIPILQGKGEVMEFSLDFKKGTLDFKMDGKHYVRVEIEKSVTYYPTIDFFCCGDKVFDFELME